LHPLQNALGFRPRLYKPERPCRFSFQFLASLALRKTYSSSSLAIVGV
jgi:hypothetical protein